MPRASDSRSLLALYYAHAFRSVCDGRADAGALSLDVPFGLYAITGIPSVMTVHAEVTLTLAFRCEALRRPPHSRPSVTDTWATLAFRRLSTTPSTGPDS